MGKQFLRCIFVVTVPMTFLLGLQGCKALKCGPGTHAQNGQCVPEELDTDGGLHCGGKTVLVGNECRAAEGICGPDTMIVFEIDDAGVPTGYFHCEGMFRDGHEPPPDCPEEFGPAGEICINGYVHWFMDERGGEGALLEHRIIEPDATADATRLAVEVHDLMAYAQDPENTLPLAVAEVNPLNATFRVTGVAVPWQGALAFLTVGFGDATDLFAPVGKMFHAVPYENLLEVAAFGATHDQVAAWTEAVGGDPALAASGCPEPSGGGPRTLVTCGTWIEFYVNLVEEEGDFVLRGLEGVIPETASGDLPPENTFFPGIVAGNRLVFDDPAPGVVWSDDQGPHEWTGIMGTIFGVNVPLGNMTARCAPDSPCAESNCEFWSGVGGSVRGALFVGWHSVLFCR